MNPELLKNISTLTAIAVMAISPVDLYAQSARSKLLIGHDCQPVSLVTKLSLAAKSTQEKVVCWQEQKLAVEQSFEQDIKIMQNKRINKGYDDAIEEIERQRRQALFATSGVNIPEIPRDLQNKINASQENAQALIADVERQIMKSKIDWLAKCRAYAEQQSK